MVLISQATTQEDLRRWIRLLKIAGFLRDDKRDYLASAREFLETHLRCLRAADPFKGLCLLAWRAGELVGSVSLTPYSDHCWLIHQLATHPQCRTSSVAYDLIREALSTVLNTGNANEAILFYRPSTSAIVQLVSRVTNRGSVMGLNLIELSRLTLWQKQSTDKSLIRSSKSQSIAVVPFSFGTGATPEWTFGTPLFERSMSIREPSLGIACLAECWAKDCLVRQRHLLTSPHLSGRTLVLQDVAPSGLNLSGLLDCCRLFVAANCRVPNEEAGLLASAIAERDETRKLFYILTPQDQVDLTMFGFTRLRTYNQATVDLTGARNSPRSLDIALPARRKAIP